MKPLPRPVVQRLEPVKPPFSDEINDADLKRLWARMKPLVLDDDGDLCWATTPSDLRTIAYTWEVKADKKAKGLDPISTIRTLHSYGYYGMFKPSVSEVLAALNKLPAEVQDEIVAWHLTGPYDANDLNHESEALNAGYQVAYATLYRKVAE